VEKVWSNSAQNTGIRAKTNKMGLTERAAAISVSLNRFCTLSQKPSGISIRRDRLKTRIKTYQTAMAPSAVQFSQASHGAFERLKATKARAAMAKRGMPMAVSRLSHEPRRGPPCAAWAERNTRRKPAVLVTRAGGMRT